MSLTIYSSHHPMTPITRASAPVCWFPHVVGQDQLHVSSLSEILTSFYLAYGDLTLMQGEVTVRISGRDIGGYTKALSRRNVVGDHVVDIVYADDTLSFFLDGDASSSVVFLLHPMVTERVRKDVTVILGSAFYPPVIDGYSVALDIRPSYRYYTVQSYFYSDNVYTLPYDPFVGPDLVAYPDNSLSVPFDVIMYSAYSFSMDYVGSSASLYVSNPDYSADYSANPMGGGILSLGEFTRPVVYVRPPFMNLSGVEYVFNGSSLITEIVEYGVSVVPVKPAEIEIYNPSIRVKVGDPVDVVYSASDSSGDVSSWVTYPSDVNYSVLIPEVGGQPNPNYSAAYPAVGDYVGTVHAKGINSGLASAPFYITTVSDTYSVVMRGPSKVVFSGSPEYMAYVDHGAEVYDQDGHLDVSLTALLNVQFYDAMGVCRYSYVQSRGHRAMSEYTFVDQCVLVRYSLCVDGNYISAERPFTFMSVLKAPVITDRKVV